MRGDTLFVPNEDLLASLTPRERSALAASRTMLRPPVICGVDPYSGTNTVFFGSLASLAPVLERVTRATKRALRGVMSEDEATNLKLLARLNDLAELRRIRRTGRIFRMRWREGDTVVWNNLTVCHRGDVSPPRSAGNRWMRRSLIRSEAADAEFYAAFDVKRRLTPAGLVDVATIDDAFREKLRDEDGPYRE